MHRTDVIDCSRQRAARLRSTRLPRGIALALQRRDPSWGLITALGFVLALVIFAVYLARIRVYEDADFALMRHDALS